MLGLFAAAPASHGGIGQRAPPSPVGARGVLGTPLRGLRRSCRGAERGWSPSGGAACQVEGLAFCPAPLQPPAPFWAVCPRLS